MSGHPFDGLEARGKPPATARAIESWIQAAERRVGVGAGRLGWMVASGVLIAAMQRAQHVDGLPRLLVKGGAYLELRLGLKARATKDIDALFRGDFDDLLAVLDEALSEPFDGIAFGRSPAETIAVPGRVLKPQRFEVQLLLRGKTWRRIRLEVSPDEGGAGDQAETFPAPSLAHFGVNTPATNAGILIDYQVAQKLHACTDPHTDDHPNDRVRDVVDLQLLQAAFYCPDKDLAALARACRRLFEARAQDAAAQRLAPRTWPPTIVAHNHWSSDYRTYAQEVGWYCSLEHAVARLNAWLGDIDQA